MRVTDKYVFFWKGWLSNFWRAPFTDNDIDISFFCTEQYFMYRKAIMFGDDEQAEEILRANSPQVCRNLGQKVVGYKDDIWSSVREEIMFKCNYLKYKQNPDLGEKLIKLGEGRHFVEASPYDRIWAIGIEETDDRCLDPKNWLGTNLLGKTLDKVRLALR